jgi:putative flippase GtrA
VSDNWRATGIRWLKFNTVGGIGIAVQLVALTVLKSGLHVDYLPATALAVETAVIHNFIWHERFTWKDRQTGRVLTRLLKFNLTTGALSILGNLLLMGFFVERLSLNYLFANVVTIAACSILNFAVSDRFVFAGGGD